MPRAAPRWVDHVGGWAKFKVQGLQRAIALGSGIPAIAVISNS